MDKEERTNLDDLMISLSRLLMICNEIIDECHRNDRDPIQLESAVAAVELYANKARN